MNAERMASIRKCFIFIKRDLRAANTRKMARRGQRFGEFVTTVTNANALKALRILMNEEYRTVNK